LPANPRSVRQFLETFPDGKVVDGAPARSKELDRQNFRVLEARLGGVRGVRQFARNRGVGASTLMEADWLATDTGILSATTSACCAVGNGPILYGSRILSGIDANIQSGSRSKVGRCRSSAPGHAQLQRS
jgi:hypothetical protein